MRRHHQRAGGRAARAEPERAPQQKRHRQIGQQIIVNAIDEPGAKRRPACRRPARPRKPTPPAARRKFQRHNDGAAQTDEDRRQHQHGQRVRHPPVQQVREQRRPGKFIVQARPAALTAALNWCPDPGHQQIRPPRRASVPARFQTCKAAAAGNAAKGRRRCCPPPWRP